MTGSRMPLRFGAPWGRAIRWVSALATALLLGVPLCGTIGWPPESGPARWLVVVVPLAILVGTALFAVCGFEVADRSLRVRRPGWTTRIPLQGLQSASFEPGVMKGSWRLAGNGGLFACTGLFRNRRLGNYRAYVTDLNRCVVLRLPKRTVVVSPDRPEAFLEALNQAAGVEAPNTR